MPDRTNEPSFISHRVLVDAVTKGLLGGALAFVIVLAATLLTWWL